MWSAFISEELASSKNEWEDSETSSSKFQPPLLLQGLPTKLIFYPTLLLIH